ncbi:MAG: hypothetical protein MMC23_005415 [Stictis urceolatum]|nr:hypothetical protein [Stictis urceolata]
MQFSMVSIIALASTAVAHPFYPYPTGTSAPLPTSTSPPIVTGTAYPTSTGYAAPVPRSPVEWSWPDVLPRVPLFN